MSLLCCCDLSAIQDSSNTMESDSFDTTSADVDLIDASSSRIPRCLRRLSSFLRHRKVAERRCPLSFDNPNYVEIVERKPFKSCQTPGGYCAFCDGLSLTPARNRKASMRNAYETLRKRIRLAKSRRSLDFNSFEDSMMALSLAYEDTSSENSSVPPSLRTCYYSMLPINSADDEGDHFSAASSEEESSDVAVSLRQLIEDCDMSESGTDPNEGGSVWSFSGNAEEAPSLPTVTPFRVLDEDKSWLKLVWDKMEPSCFYIVLDFNATRLSRSEAKKLLSLSKADFHQVMRYVVGELKRHHDHCKTKLT